MPSERKGHELPPPQDAARTEQATQRHLPDRVTALFEHLQTLVDTPTSRDVDRESVAAQIEDIGYLLALLGQTSTALTVLSRLDAATTRWGEGIRDEDQAITATAGVLAPILDAGPTAPAIWNLPPDTLHKLLLVAKGIVRARVHSASGDAARSRRSPWEWNTLQAIQGLYGGWRLDADDPTSPRLTFPEDMQREAAQVQQAYRADKDEVSRSDILARKLRLEERAFERIWRTACTRYPTP